MVVSRNPGGRKIKRTARAFLLAALALGLGQGGGWAQEKASFQLWSNFTLGHTQSHRLYFELDTEPKIQASGTDAFRNIDLTPAVEYYPCEWIDLTGEATAGFTKQNAGVNSFEYTGRVGIRVHLLSSDRKKVFPKRKMLGRIVLANFTRLEYRNFAYSGDTPTSHEWRLRDRLEFKYPLNRARMSLPKTLYFSMDAEAFVPLSERAPETFASKFRVRAGFGFRHSETWRAEVFYIRDWAHNTFSQFENNVNAVDLRFQLFF